MRLTKHSDYALRVLLFAATHRERLVSTEEISTTFGISMHHLVKIVNKLGKAGFLELRRGRTGGLRLAKPPEQICLGEVVRCTEPDFHLVECLSHAERCPITPACGLILPLKRATKAFLEVLDGYTLADATGAPGQKRYDRLLNLLD